MSTDPSALSIPFIHPQQFYDLPLDPKNALNAIPLITEEDVAHGCDLFSIAPVATPQAGYSAPLPCLTEPSIGAPIQDQQQQQQQQLEPEQQQFLTPTVLINPLPIDFAGIFLEDVIKEVANQVVTCGGDPVYLDSPNSIALLQKEPIIGLLPRDTTQPTVAEHPKASLWSPGNFLLFGGDCRPSFSSLLPSPQEFINPFHVPILSPSTRMKTSPETQDRPDALLLPGFDINGPEAILVSPRASSTPTTAPAPSSSSPSMSGFGPDDSSDWRFHAPSLSRCSSAPSPDLVPSEILPWCQPEKGLPVDELELSIADLDGTSKIDVDSIEGLPDLPLPNIIPSVLHSPQGIHQSLLHHKHDRTTISTTELLTRVYQPQFSDQRRMRWKLALKQRTRIDTLRDLHNVLRQSSTESEDKGGEEERRGEGAQFRLNISQKSHMLATLDDISKFVQSSNPEFTSLLSPRIQFPPVHRLFPPGPEELLALSKKLPQEPSINLQLRSFLTPCHKALVVCVFDVLSLIIGVHSVNASSRVVQEVVEMLLPLLPRIEELIAVIADEDSGVFTQACACYCILQLIVTQGYWDVVIGAYVGSLTLADAVLASVQTTAFILSGVSTGGLALVARLVLTITNGTFLIIHSIEAGEICQKKKCNEDGCSPISKKSTSKALTPVTGSKE